MALSSYCFSTFLSGSGVGHGGSVEDFQKSKHISVFSRSVHNSSPLERQRPVRDAHSHSGLCSLASVCFMSKATCLQVTDFSNAFLRLGSQVHTFRGPHWCEYCANFMWGLIAQGVRCSGRHGAFLPLPFTSSAAMMSWRASLQSGEIGPD